MGDSEQTILGYSFSAGIRSHDRDSRHLGVLSRLGRGVGRRRPDRCCCAGGALHAQEARRPIPRGGDSTTASARRPRRRRNSITSGFYDKPLLKFERLLETYLAFAPAGFRSFLQGDAVWLHSKLHLPREMTHGLEAAAIGDVASSPSTTSRTRPARSFLPRSTKRRSSRSTAWANGPPPVSATAAATASR